MNQPAVVAAKPSDRNYLVRKARGPVELSPAWDHPIWTEAPTLEVASFRPESSSHRPRTLARLLYAEDGIHEIFQVKDRFVRCARTRYFDEVWKDSCVEFFAQPKPESGYFNFEFNCGGAFLCSYIVDPERTPNRFKDFTRIPAALGQTIRTSSTLPPKTDPELAEQVTWCLRFFIPFALFEHYTGRLGRISGQTWRGNFFKCAEEVTHPHWASWAPVDEFNFHRPACFGRLRFAEA